MKSSSFAGGCERGVETPSGVVGVQQEVNEYSRHGDVEPDGIGPLGYFLVGEELARGGEEQGPGDEGHHHHGENDVGDEYEEIDGPNPALACKFGVALKIVINEIADEKGGGSHGGGYHHGRVLFLQASLNEE